MKNLQVALDEAIHQRLKHVAADRSETLANLIREAVQLLIAEHEGKRTNATGGAR